MFLIDSPNSTNLDYDMGFVYFLLLDEKYVKIGFSQCPYRRYFEIQAHNPTHLSLIGIMEGSIADERRLHKLFAKQRVRNEWFAYSQQISDFVDQNCDMPDFWEMDETHWPSLSVPQLRKNLSQTLLLVQKDKQRVVIKKYGKPVAAIVPIEDLQYLDDLDQKIYTASS